MEPTGSALGVDGNKCGDHVVTLNVAETRGREVRIVFEDKARSVSIRAALSELERAMSNREAEVGVMVFASSDTSPLKGRSLRMYPGATGLSSRATRKATAD